MECRPVEIKLISASGIKDVNTLSKMDVYVVVSVSGDPRSVQRSPVDKDGGVNPRWSHHEMRFVVDEVAAQNSRIGFVFQIMSNRTLGDKEAGRVYIPVKELLDRYEHGAKAASDRPHQEVDYQVRTPSGKLRGTFKFSYTFGDKCTQRAPLIEEPLPPMAYPPAVPSFTPSVFPPPTAEYAATVPFVVPYPALAYGQQPAAGYGYPGAMAAPRPMVAGTGTGTGMGMGAATGIGMGLLGGLMIGEMVDEGGDVAFD